ncbi:hypothetical protein F4679DRAFT_558100 [Xylaria curta]|nr:hypothetical protein F4679DRAFT_558100 [Xylaria curta]
MADTSSCPEDTNSTDCLLRVLVQRIDNHFEEYSWDPITFGFSVPVGIIAALFAAFTIYQAIINAGRGSRKSNRRAIGAWSSATTKGWDWHELCRISTAKTPILTTSGILGILDSPFVQVWPEYYKMTGQEPWKAHSDDPPVASWLEFLNALGFDNLDLNKIPRKTLIADYLPDDLLAVPAYGEVGFIVAAAAAAGAYSWKIDERSGYPTVLGRSFQFQFRQHQTFGTIGAFIRYNYGLKVPPPPTMRQLRTALLQARGDLKFSLLPSRNFNAKTDATSRRFNVLNDSAKSLIAFLRQRRPGPDHDCRSGLCKCDELFTFGEDRHHLSWLFLANTPTRPPVIFPSNLTKNSNAFAFLACHSKFWASLETKRWFFSVDKNTPEPNLIPSYERWHNPDFPTRLDQEEIVDILRFLDERTGQREEDVKHNKEPFSISHTEFQNPETTYIFGIVLEASVKFLYDMGNFRTWFKHLQQFIQQYFRVLTLLQLIQIDTRLAGYDSKQLLCATISLSTTTLALLDVDSALSNGSLEHSIPKEMQYSLGGEDSQIGCPEDDISAPHLKTLEVLGQLTDEFAELIKDKIDDEMIAEGWTNFHSIREKFRKNAFILSYLTHISPARKGLKLFYHSSEIITLIRALEKVLQNHRASISSNMTFTREQTSKEHDLQELVPHTGVSEGAKYDHVVDQSSQGEGEKGELRKEELEPNESNEDTIRDLLIWRCILIGILFSTAPDNSDLLSSSVWERVVRII